MKNRIYAAPAVKGLTHLEVVSRYHDPQLDWVKIAHIWEQVPNIDVLVIFMHYKSRIATAILDL